MPQDRNAKPQKIAVVVAGMHRSGTSALTRVFNLLGCALPKTLLAPSDSNRQGFWESPLVNRFNDEVLTSAGLHWRDWVAFDPGWYDRPQAIEFRERAVVLLREEFGDAQFLVLKDPRICRLMRFWGDTLEAFGARPVVVTPLRNPLEVAASLEKRNGFEQKISCLIWLRYVLDAELETRRLRRAFVSFDALSDNEPSAIARMVAELDLTWPVPMEGAGPEIAAFLRRDHRHHVALPQSLAQQSALTGWLRTSFDILSRWTHEQPRPADLRKLTQVRRELDEASATFGAPVSALQSASAKARSVAETRDELARREKAAADELRSVRAKLKELTAKLARRDAEMAAVGPQLAAVTERLSRLASQNAEREAKAEAAANELRAVRADLKSTTDRLARRDSELAVVSRQLGEFREVLSRMATQIVEGERKSQAAMTRVSKLGSDLAKATNGLLERERKAKESAAEIQSLKHEMSRLSRELAGRQESLDRERTSRQGFQENFARLRSELAETKAQYAQQGRELAFLKQTKAGRGLAFGGVFIGVRANTRSGDNPQLSRDSELDQAIAVIAQSALFDRDWYLAANPDVAEAGIEPAAHYFQNGAAEGRDPGPHFSTRWYWRRNADVAAANINPLVHYLMYGRAEGRLIAPASDDGDSWQESGTTEDNGSSAVDAERSQPIAVEETAAPEQENDTAETKAESGDEVGIIAASGLFDAAWYLAKYPDVAKSGADPVSHYLQFGAQEGRDPGPQFSAGRYLELYKDVAAAGTNPLVHYLRYGQPEGRKRFPVAEPAQRTSPQQPVTLAPVGEACDPVSFPLPAIEPVPWVRHKDIAGEPARPLVELSGLALGFLPGDRPDAVRNGLAEQARTIRTFCRMMRIDPDSVLRLPAGSPTENETGFLASEGPCIGSLKSPRPGGWMQDLWFTSDYDLRMRFDVPANSSREPFVIRGFQYAPAGRALSLVAEALVGGNGPEFVDVALVNPFCPLLLCTTNCDGYLSGAALLPFPSLCRGGVHHSEFRALAKATYLDDLTRISAAFLDGLLGAPSLPPDFSIGRIEVDVRDAIGAERIFSDHLQEWLAHVVGVSLAPAGKTGSANPKVQQFLVEGLTRSVQETDDRRAQRERNGSFTLTLPEDAVPAIGALVARDIGVPTGQQTAIGSFIVNGTQGAPEWAVRVPPLGDDLVAVQPAVAASKYPQLRCCRAEVPRGDANGISLAVRFPRRGAQSEAELAMPIALDAGPIVFPRTLSQGKTISVIVSGAGGDQSSFARLVKSLRDQACDAEVDVIVPVDRSLAAPEAIEAVLRRYFPDRHALIGTAADCETSEYLKTAAQHSGRFLLFADADVVLHDPRTLAALAAVAEGDGVASAGCVMIKAAPDNPERIVFHSGGTLAVERPRPSGSLHLAQPNLLSIFPLASYPVLANSAELFMVRTEIWNRVGGLGAAGETFADAAFRFSLKAIESGLFHVCTSAVTAALQSTAPASAPKRAGETPIGPEAAKAASRAIVLRSLA